MIENAKIMRCGNCGGKDHKIYEVKKRNSIIVECNDCGNLSAIGVTQPKVEVLWVDGNDGILSVF